MQENTNPTALVYGGSGALGTAIIQALNKAGWSTTSVDVKESEVAQASFVVSGESADTDAKTLDSSLGDKKFELVVGVAGGWASGSIAAPSVLNSIDKMIKFNLNSSIVVAYIAQRHLKENGLVVLTGASSALNATPMSIGYGISKAAVHQLVVSLGDEKSKMPKGSVTIGILPVTLDTPTNRQSMPKADTSTWTPLEEVASVIQSWAEGKNRPKSGSLLEAVTENSVTKWVSVTLSVVRETL
eukprot:TRINITY_DN770_c0_g1_i1.p1 TRINITY_DN770_c0_g1~~TRINITY_DN770_c0_g1_i1.p1  ORF type:complete len:243 (+),score=59.88 TRINITY_DN770_c0_g1_i1:100-828(+)